MFGDMSICYFYRKRKEEEQRRREEEEQRRKKEEADRLKKAEEERLRMENERLKLEAEEKRLMERETAVAHTYEPNLHAPSAAQLQEVQVPYTHFGILSSALPLSTPSTRLQLPMHEL